MCWHALRRSPRQRLLNRITLRQLLETALRQSTDLAKAQVDITIAEAGLREAHGSDDWQLNVDSDLATTRSKTVEGQPFQSTAEDSVGISSAIQRSLPSGGSIGLEVESAYRKQTFAVINEDGDTFDIDAAVVSGSVAATLSHPLLRGRGKRVARANQRRAARSRTITELAKQATTTNLVLDVANEYWDLVAATHKRKILQGSVTLAKQQLHLTQTAIQGKVAAPVDALAVEQAIAVREEAVLIAGVQISEHSLRLRQLVGLVIGPNAVDLVPQQKPRFIPKEIDISQALRESNQYNPQLQLLRKQSDVAQIDVEIAKSKTVPQLDLFVRAGPTGSATQVDETLRQIRRFDAFSASASLRYQQSLGNRRARGSHQRAIGNLRRHKLDVATVEKDTAVAVVRAVNRVRTSQKRIEVSRRSIKLAAKNLELERIRFSAGRATNFDVLERQDELEQANLSQIEAIVAHHKALLTLSALTGALVKEHKLH